MSHTKKSKSYSTWLTLLAVGFVLSWLAESRYQANNKNDNNLIQNEDSTSLGSKQARSTELGKIKKDESKLKEEIKVIMSDPKMTEAWGIKKTAAQDAWKISMGSKDIIVAVIDTGIDINHKDLTNNLWVNKGEVGLDPKGRDKATNGIDDDGNGFIDDINGWNFVSDNNKLTDNHGHGTHIAGIIGAEGGNGFGVSGVSPKVSIMSIKYYDPTVPNTNNLANTIKAIKYATKMGAKIINYSGGGLEYSPEEYAAISEAKKNGILFVAAAGNERSNSDKNHYYPADYPLTNIISVTAANETDSILPSSNYGQHTVDIQAPGSNIYSTLPGGLFGNMTGTSQATAFATGVAVLVWANNKEFDAEQVKKYILKTGDDVPQSQREKTRYNKRLNSYKALATLDQDVAASGVVAKNTQELKHGTFTLSEGGKEVKVTGSGLVSVSSPEMNEDINSVDATEKVVSFQRDLNQVLKQAIKGSHQPAAEQRN